MTVLPLDPSLAAFETRASEAAGLLKALANEKRLMILCKLLEAGEVSVTRLSEDVGLSQSALSQHLSRMRGEGILASRRVGKSIFYSVTDKAVARVLSTLKAIYC